MLQHVIVPLDGSALAERALEYAASEHFHVPDPDYAGPPAFHRGTFRLDPVARQGAEPGLAQAIPSLGFPGGEQISPDVILRLVLRAGANALEVREEKIGEVGELSVEFQTGRLTRLTLRHGFAGRTVLDLPISWIQETSDKGVVLNVSKRGVEELAAPG